MIVVRDASKLEGKPLVATIGFFDGVHIGHRFLIGEMNRIARENGLSSTVITFPDHPRAVLQADYPPQLLNSFELSTSDSRNSPPMPSSMISWPGDCTSIPY